jgi:hypothetical protein
LQRLFKQVICLGGEALKPMHGNAQPPDDLSKHPCLLYLQNGRVYDKWNLGGQTVQVSGPLFSDDADVVRRWSLEGEVSPTNPGWMSV